MVRFVGFQTSGSRIQFFILHTPHRRHLTESQRAMVAVKLAEVEPGDPEFECTNLRR